ncbi:MAG TPA: hypothetical protein VFG15_30265 [Amycolatopsis sp.]|nr:hypothetical protein [Amycolatopsis sp.]
MLWPITLDKLKRDLKIPLDDERDDVELQDQLDAAVYFIRRVRAGSFNFDGDPMSTLDEPTPDLCLGVVRLAGRWFTRRRSPDALIAMADAGSARVPSFDPDIDRLLGIGKYRGPVYA